MNLPFIMYAFYIATILLMLLFIFNIVSTRKVMTIHKCYFGAAVVMIVWLLALIGISYTPETDIATLYFWDSLTTAGAACLPVFSLLFSICYTREYETKVPPRFWLLFAIPILTVLMVATNEYHHLYYRVFSFFNTDVVFGPYFYIHCTYTFTCVIVSVVLMIRYAVKRREKLYYWQATLFALGGLAPSVVNLLVILNVISVSVTATPISFIITMILHGIIIYRLHLFDVQPLAMQQLVDWMSDGYLVLNGRGEVVSFNKPFRKILGKGNKIRENIRLADRMQDVDIDNKTALYNLLTGVRSCLDSNTKVTYEQVINSKKGMEPVKCYYLVEIKPLISRGEVCGVLAIFKDITELKRNMQRLQDSQVKMMEQERLAFLGQMVGGLAHNLKTPIMSVSGSLTAMEKLVQESRISIGDPEVTAEDYREIYGEMDTWIDRMRDACAYMSDIISAVKGQASSMSVSESRDFSVEEVLKRVYLLLRHELTKKNCNLQPSGDMDIHKTFIHGDINNLVQVLTNLVSNSIDAQVPQGRRDIFVDVGKDSKDLIIRVIDFGSGIPENIKRRLLKQMVTSKGTMGTGLGLFISNTVIKAKFDGSMRVEDNPDGGTIIRISIPLEIVTLRVGNEVSGK
ncbi:MAG TPA: PAS domain-containing protein [Candidatus Limivivens intestinipullorum]|uniref:histidine kinase n=1 Tax=Candidatus Limivivens intestinipullorum TaxID=2840858 RepID=A0A9D1JL94_9FIRM|nr:PAS domain-containing protein [Candidatus Limivivens intestinipullorum]